jgi:hypothetical protein
LYHRQVGGSGIGGNFYLRFDNENGRNVLCDAVEAMVHANWIKEGFGCA